jgi:hypothetical protein
MSTGEVPGGDVEAERALIDERERAAYKKKTQEHCKEVLRQVELKRKSEELYNHGFGWQTDVGIDPSVLVEAKERVHSQDLLKSIGLVESSTGRERCGDEKNPWTWVDVRVRSLIMGWVMV